MKKLVVLSLAAAAVLFTGCGQETKKAAGEAATAVKKTAEVAVEETKEATTEAATSAKETMDEAVEATTEVAAPVVEAAQEKVEEVTEAVKEAVSTEEANASDAASEESEAPATEETTEEASAPAEAAVDTEAGKALYVKCAACHGPDGKMKALGKSAVIAGQSAADLEMKITEYKAGTRDVAGMGAMMKVQVSGLSDEDVKAVSAYISTL